jgi:hypothetical protein
LFPSRPISGLPQSLLPGGLRRGLHGFELEVDGDLVADIEAAVLQSLAPGDPVTAANTAAMIAFLIVLVVLICLSLSFAVFGSRFLRVF